MKARGLTVLAFALLTIAAACCDEAAPAPAATQPSAGSTPAPARTVSPTPTADATRAPTPSVPLPQISLERVYPALAFQRMTGLYQAPDGGSRWYVTEQRGRVLAFEDRPDVRETPVFLDISDRVSNAGNEEGLLGLAFAPDFATSRAFYVYYSAANPRRSVLSRFQANAAGTSADPRSESLILEVAQPFSNHNGGQIAFGPDRFLYVGLGDGGSGRDPMGNGQNLGALLGKLLRLDVSGAGNGRAYRVPPDNPFVGRSGARDEIYAYGLRNPWRFSWDAETGRLWLADVGQNNWEEVDVIEKGGNYGWSIMEATHCLPGTSCTPTGILPVVEYPTGQSCSVTGGFVYHGGAIAALRGAYVYGDYCSGRIWGLRYDGEKVTEEAELIDSSIQISSFAVDRGGGLYALAHSNQGGGIFKLAP